MASEAAFTHYQRWSIRIPRSLLAHVKTVAFKEGWELSDLVRTLTVLGASGSWLKFQKQENLDHFRKLVQVAQMADMLNAAVSHKLLAAYPIIRQPPFTGRTSVVVTLIIPVGLARLVEVYAATTKISRSNACERFLTVGLTAYLTSENALLHAIQQARG